MHFQLCRGGNGPALESGGTTSFHYRHSVAVHCGVSTQGGNEYQLVFFSCNEKRVQTSSGEGG